MNRQLTNAMTRAEQVLRYGMIYTLTERLPLYMVVEFPRSGGTWFGQMAADALDVPFPRHGDGTPALKPQLMHGHYRYSSRFHNTFHVIRDGRDVMVSLYYYRLFKNDLHNKPMTAEQQQAIGITDPNDIWDSMPRFLEHSFTAPLFPKFSWTQYVEQWLGRADAEVRYEDMLADPVDVVAHAVREVTGRVVPHDRLQEIADKYSFAAQAKRAPGQEAVNRFMRKGVAGDWREKFSPEAREIFDHYAGDLLIRLGYEPNHEWVSTRAEISS